MTSHPILKFLRNDYYPYIVLPESIELHLQGPQLPPRPLIPSKPEMPAKPIEPALPKIPKKVMEKFQALSRRSRTGWLNYSRSTILFSCGGNVWCFNLS
jgi:hypothetical protein